MLTEADPEENAGNGSSCLVRRGGAGCGVELTGVISILGPATISGTTSSGAGAAGVRCRRRRGEPLGVLPSPGMVARRCPAGRSRSRGRSARPRPGRGRQETCDGSCSSHTSTPSVAAGAARVAHALATVGGRRRHIGKGGHGVAHRHAAGSGVDVHDVVELARRARRHLGKGPDQLGALQNRVALMPVPDADEAGVVQHVAEIVGDDRARRQRPWSDRLVTVSVYVIDVSGATVEPLGGSEVFSRVQTGSSPGLLLLQGVGHHDVSRAGSPPPVG